MNERLTEPGLLQMASVWYSECVVGRQWTAEATGSGDRGEVGRWPEQVLSSRADLEVTMPTILVIDDMEAIVDTVRQSVPDWTVLSACDGVDGLEMLKQHYKTIDLILLDVQMPRMDGREALPRIRALYPHIPVRLWSGSVDSTDKRLALELTGRPLVEKPIRRSELTVEIYQTLGLEVPPPRPEEPLPRQAAEMPGRPLSKPVLIICKSDRERADILIMRLKSAKLGAGLIQSPLHAIRMFTQQPDFSVVVAFYDDFQDILPLNRPYRDLWYTVGQRSPSARSRCSDILILRSKIRGCWI